MAVAYANRIQRGLAAAYDRGRWTLTDVWQVATTLAADGAYTAITAATLPGYGDQHTQAASAKLIRKTARRKGSDEDSRRLWLVECDYETPSGVDPTDDPADEAPRISFAVRQYETVADGVPDPDNPGELLAILNSAGDPFNPPPNKSRYNLVCTIIRNEKADTFDPANLDTYIDTLNDDSITIAGITGAAGTARMVDMSASTETRRGEYAYREVTYVIEWSRHHLVDILSTGFFQLDAAGNHVPCEVGGSKATAPQRLDEDGHQITDPAAASYWIPSVDLSRGQVDWTPLNLPANEWSPTPTPTPTPTA